MKIYRIRVERGAWRWLFDSLPFASRLVCYATQRQSVRVCARHFLSFISCVRFYDTFSCFLLVGIDFKFSCTLSQPDFLCCITLYTFFRACLCTAYV